MNEKYDRETLAADVAIVGLGPGGLAAALRAASLGHGVVAFTDRHFTDTKKNDYIRGQRVLLDHDTIAFLRTFENSSDQSEDDIKFFATLRKEKAIQTKDIERFLYTKLQKFPNVTIVQLSKDLHITSVGRVETRLADFIELNNGSRYFCRNILAADGAKRRFSSLINETMGLEIEYNPTMFQRKHPYQGIVQLQIKKPDEDIDGLAGATETTSEHQQPPASRLIKQGLSYAKLGWNAESSPNHYLFTNTNHTKFYFAGEIPQRIFELSGPERDEKLKEWAALFIHKEYGISADKLEYKSRDNPKKQSLQSTAFEMNMKCCNKPLCPLSHGFLGIIGDARRDPHFYLGHGLNDAITLGVGFAGRLPREGFATSFDSESYLNTVRILDRHIDKKMEENPACEPRYARKDRKFTDAMTPARMQDFLIKSTVNDIKLFSAVANSEQVKDFMKYASIQQQKTFINHANHEQLISFIQHADIKNISIFCNNKPVNENNIKLFATHAVKARQIEILIQMSSRENVNIVLKNLGRDQINMFTTIASRDLIEAFAENASEEQLEQFRQSQATPTQIHWCNCIRPLTTSRKDEPESHNIKGLSP